MVRSFSALVLAGDRPGGDPFARSLGVSHKALLPVGGKPMLSRVVETLMGCSAVGLIAVSCARATLEGELPSELAALHAEGKLSLLDAQATPSASVLHAVDTLPASIPLLVTTADHPLLTPAIVTQFLERARSSGADAVVGLTPAALVQSAFPETQRTLFRMREGAYCACNLFALLTPEARTGVLRWREIEQRRKRPWSMMLALGPMNVGRFLLRRLSLDDVIGLVSVRMGFRADVALVSQPEAAIDVDRQGDLDLAEEVLRRRG